MSPSLFFVKYTIARASLLKEAVQPIARLASTPYAKGIDAYFLTKWGKNLALYCKRLLNPHLSICGLLEMLVTPSGLQIL